MQSPRPRGLMTYRQARPRRPHRPLLPPHRARVSASIASSAIRGGLATLDYDDGNPLSGCGEFELSGSGWFVDGEVGWRHNNWSFGAFASYLSHDDSAAGTGGWNIHLRVTEVGLRATWHHGPFSVGAGFMPWSVGHQWGQESIQDIEDPPFNNYVPFSINERDHMFGGELHIGLDLARTDSVRLQLFGLIEDTAALDAYTLTSARFGLGVVF